MVKKGITSIHYNNQGLMFKKKNEWDFFFDTKTDNEKKN